LTLSAHSGASHILKSWGAFIPGDGQSPGASQTAPEPFFSHYLSRLAGVGFFDSVYAVGNPPSLGDLPRLAKYVLAHHGSVFSVFHEGADNTRANDRFRSILGAGSERSENIPEIGAEGRFQLASNGAEFPVPPCRPATGAHFYRQKRSGRLLPHHFAMLAESDRYAKFAAAMCPYTSPIDASCKKPGTPAAKARPPSEERP
jgi:hypothetical protein